MIMGNEFSKHQTVAQMAEFLSGPTTLIDSKGKHYSFRKYLWMGNWGFTDVKGMDVIVPAKPGYLQADIFVHSHVLVAGCHATGWDIFSLKGEKIKSFPPMSLNELSILIDKSNITG